MKLCGGSPSISFEAIKASAVFSDVYRFFNVIIAVKSDRENMLDRFRRLYPRFREKNADEEAGATYYTIVEMPGKPFIIAEENSHLKIRSMGCEHSAMLYTYLLAFSYIAVSLKSHFLFHGAAVSRDGDGMVISGPSYYGKTSLTLQLLLRKGFRFLSDDQLAINRETRLIDPFPRGIGIRENTLAFFDELQIEHLESYMDGGGQRKWLVDISEISENGVGEPCRLKYLVFLVNSLDEAAEGEQYIELTLDGMNDRLMVELQNIAVNGEVHCRDLGGIYILTFRPESEMPSTLEVERLCENCGAWLMDMEVHSNVEPDFSLTPQIRQVPWHMAVMSLLKGLHNDFRGTPVPTFLELAEILEGVECYELSIGKLDEMGEHICSLMLN